MGSEVLEALASDASGQLHILGHDGDSLGVDGTEVGVLKESDDVRLGRLLEGEDGVALELEIALVLLGDLPDQPLERKFADEELGLRVGGLAYGLLEFPYFPQSHRPWAEPVRLLQSSRHRRRLPRGLAGDVLARSFGPRVLASSLLGSCHYQMLLQSPPSLAFISAFLPARPIV